MQKCDPRAIARCPDSKKCGVHVFADGSDCDKFNQRICNAASGAEGKCGDCLHFKPIPAMRSDTKGICDAGYGERRTYMSCKYRFKTKVASHGDRIRGMDDEEHARFLVRVVSDGCPSDMNWDCRKDEDGWDACDKCWEKWLRQPAEGKEKPEHPLR